MKDQKVTKETLKEAYIEAQKQYYKTYDKADLRQLHKAEAAFHSFTGDER